MVHECSHEIGCYAQFSGPLNPTQMYGFTKTVLDLILAEQHPDGKVLVTGSQAIDVTTLVANNIGPGAVRTCRKLLPTLLYLTPCHQIMLVLG